MREKPSDILQERVIGFWRDMDGQNWESIHRHFEDNAVIRWHNTNEQFTANEFASVNAQYPGDWQIRVDRLECAGSVVVSVVNVRLKDGDASFHATSFFSFGDGKIQALDEYWGDDGKPPQWRIDKRIGVPIQKD